MVLVIANAILAEEALVMGQKKYEELKQLLMEINSDLIKVMNPDEAVGEKVIFAKFSNIQNLVENANKKIKEVHTKDLDTKGLDEFLMAILELINTLNCDIKFRTLLISIETQTVLAHSCVSWITESQRIIEDPKNGRQHVKGFTFDGEEKRLATVFGARFPKWYGYQVQVIRRGTVIEFELKDGPSEWNADDISLLDALEQEMDKFLRWELRKSIVDMEFKIFKSGGTRKFVRWQINPVDYGYIYTD